jgi:hypothetical protein
MANCGCTTALGTWSRVLRWTIQKCSPSFPSHPKRSTAGRLCWRLALLVVTIGGLLSWAVQSSEIRRLFRRSPK